MCYNIDDDCCCCCFSVRTGVCLIGILTWIGLIGSVFALITTLDLWWYYVPTVLCLGFAAISFQTMRKSEGADDERQRRQDFFQAYLWCVLIFNTLWTLGWRISGSGDFYNALCHG